MSQLPHKGPPVTPSAMQVSLQPDPDSSAKVPMSQPPFKGPGILTEHGVRVPISCP